MDYESAIRPGAGPAAAAAAAAADALAPPLPPLPPVPPIPALDLTTQSRSSRPRDGQHHHHSQRRSQLRVQSSLSSAARRDHLGRPASPPASPEVISSLITSLADLPSSAVDIPPLLSSGQSSSPAVSPSSPSRAGGSFGVEYGSAAARSSISSSTSPSHLGLGRSSSIRKPPPAPLDLDELAACPPVVRTAKPPSGLSALTAPKLSPRGDPVVDLGIRSALLRSSSTPPPPRPLSRDSALSVHSIGNVSIERAFGPPNLPNHRHSRSPHAREPELRRQRSHDSWGRKQQQQQQQQEQQQQEQQQHQGRAHRSLMYMSSKERLRDVERKRATIAIGSTGTHTGSCPEESLPLPPLPPLPPRQDLFLGDTPITEESSSSHLDLPHDRRPRLSSGRVDDPGSSSPHIIPQRDSSLAKTGSNAARRSSRRRSKRDSEPGTPISDAIPELVEERSRREDGSARHGPGHGHGRGSSRSHSHSRRGAEAAGRPSRRPDDVATNPTVTFLTSDHQVGETFLDTYQNSNAVRHQNHGHHHHRRNAAADPLAGHSNNGEEDEEDGAPFPAVLQGRRRDEHSTDRSSRRISGRFTPDTADALLRPKRSSSRMKRSSRAPSPSVRDGDRSSDTHVSGDAAAAAAAAAAASAESPPAPNLPHGYERPRSADSVDDAVESYLCSPRLSQKIRHPQTGRVISFSEVGDSEGFAVFCCVGMGLTRYVLAFYDELALALRLRLITPDRPGVGDSEPYTDGTSTPLSWPDDVYAICQALKITKFSILAHSAGAIYALATALRMPQHIRGRIHLLAPWIPPSQMSTFGASQTQPPANSIPTAQRILRALPTPMLKVANSSFMAATSSSLTSSLPRTPRKKRATAATSGKQSNGADKPTAEDMGLSLSLALDAAAVTATENMDRIRPTHSHVTLPRPGGGSSTALAVAAASAAAAGSGDTAVDLAINAAAEKERQNLYDERLTHAIWELATTNANPAVDLLVCLERRHTIGFRYVDITRPVVIHHGSRDTRVPVENVKWLGKMMRRCEVRVLEGEGHGLMASAAVMGGVLMEIGKEWEDWQRATGGSRGRERERRAPGRG